MTTAERALGMPAARLLTPSLTRGLRSSAVTPAVRVGRCITRSPVAVLRYAHSPGRERLGTARQPAGSGGSRLGDDAGRSSAGISASSCTGGGRA